MIIEPVVKRTVVFVDGQNLFYAAKNAFGHNYPNYDVRALATALCTDQNWHLDQTRFYTGVPDYSDNAVWNHFWTAKLAQEIRRIATAQKRWIKMACAFPNSPASTNRRGINGADWIRIDRARYDSCLDTRDYRPKTKPTP